MSITGQTSPKIASTLTRESKKVDKQIADYITQIQNLES
jgi:ribosomal protein S17E